MVLLKQDTLEFGPLMFKHVFFNDFVKQNIEKDIKRRIIINGQTASSWRFQRFNHFDIQVCPDKLKVGR